MGNLRQRIESDLARTLEGEYGTPVVLVSPDGTIIDKSVHTGEQLYGQVLYEYIQISPDTGEDMVIALPVVTLRRTSLSRVPKDKETWLVKIPVDPTEGAPIEDFIFDPTHAADGSRSIGIIRMYLTKAAQS